MKKYISNALRLMMQLINPSLSRPEAGRLIITENCPLRCKMCTFWKEKHIDPELTTIKQWIKELADFGMKEIDIGGGEPFIRKDLIEIVKEIKSYGIECGITTSGCMVDKVEFPPVDRIEVSIDGVKPETHDRIRGVKGSWEKAVQTVEMAKKHCRIGQINFVLQSENYRELVDYCLWANGLGLRVGIIPVSLKLAAQSSLSSDLKEFDIPLLKRLLDEAFKIGNVVNNREFFRIFFAKLEKGSMPQRCLAPYNMILIFANGDVYPCGNLDVAAGNLSGTKSLKEIYRDYRKLRQEIWSGVHERCGRCIYPDIANRQTILSVAGGFMGRKL